MPIYEYKCNKCNEITEDLRKVDDRDNIEICQCGGNKERAFISAPRFVFAEPEAEYVQYWKNNPKAPHGREIYPHKNKYIGGGITNEGQSNKNDSKGHQSGDGV